MDKIRVNVDLTGDLAIFWRSLENKSTILKNFVNFLYDDFRNGGGKVLNVFIVGGTYAKLRESIQSKLD